MKIIGLCGGSGSGKGTVSGIFSSFCIPVIDTDAIYHKLTSEETPCLDALRKEFGKGVIKNSALDRAALAKIVFSGEGAAARRARLNEITHTFVLKEVGRELDSCKASGHELCVVDIPLLFESGFDKECDLTVAVLAEREIRISRIIKRDGITREAAVSRIDSQLSDTDLISLADTYILNNGDSSELVPLVKNIILKLEN